MICSIYFTEKLGLSPRVMPMETGCQVLKENVCLNSIPSQAVHFHCRRVGFWVVAVSFLIIINYIFLNICLDYGKHPFQHLPEAIHMQGQRFGVLMGLCVPRLIELEDMDWPHYKVKICIQGKKEDELCTFNQQVYSCSYFFPCKLSPFASRKRENCSRFAVGVSWGPYWPSCLFVVVLLNPLIGKLPQTPASWIVSSASRMVVAPSPGTLLFFWDWTCDSVAFAF